GKAVEALKARLPRGWKSRARTLASFLWKWAPAGYNGENIEFANLGAKSPEYQCKLIVVDEASMVTRRDARALMAYRNVLYVGDADQLPPVVEDEALEPELGSAGVLDSPDVSLALVHRQSKESSILAVAEAARKGKQPEFGIMPDLQVIHLSEAEGHFGVDEL